MPKLDLPKPTAVELAEMQAATKEVVARLDGGKALRALFATFIISAVYTTESGPILDRTMSILVPDRELGTVREENIPLVYIIAGVQALSRTFDEKFPDDPARLLRSGEKGSILACAFEDVVQMGSAYIDAIDVWPTISAAQNTFRLSGAMSALPPQLLTDYAIGGLTSALVNQNERCSIARQCGVDNSLADLDPYMRLMAVPLVVDQAMGIGAMGLVTA